MIKKLGSPRIFSYICRQNSDMVALHDIVGNTEHYACLTVVKPGPSTEDMERNSVTLFNFYAKYVLY